MTVPGIRSYLVAWNLRRFLPDKISRLYWEATETFRISAYTACEMLCGTIMLEVAVDKGASRKRSFEQSVTYLYERGCLNMTQKVMADAIRTNRNKGVHKGRLPTEGRAQDMLIFTESILLSLYQEPPLLQIR